MMYALKMIKYSVSLQVYIRETVKVIVRVMDSGEEWCKAII